MNGHPAFDANSEAAPFTVELPAGIPKDTPAEHCVSCGEYLYVGDAALRITPGGDVVCVACRARFEVDI